MSAMRAGQPGVLLLGVEESPALPVIWSLARHHVPLTVGSCRRLCGGTFSNCPNRKCLYPDPAISGDAFVTWLLDMVKTGAYPVTLGCG